MSYTVMFIGGATEQRETFAAVLELCREHSGSEVFGPGYDCDSDEDGFFVCSDGLTNEERAALEEAR